MSRKIICTFVVTLFITTAVYPIADSVNENTNLMTENRNTLDNKVMMIFDDQLDQAQTIDNDDFKFFVLSGYDAAQSFIPSLEILTRVELKIEKFGDDPGPGNFTVMIRKDLDGSDLTSIMLQDDEIPLGRGWIFFDFDDIEVTPGDTYYIVCSSEGGIIANYYLWRGSDSNPYPRGIGHMYNPLGENWQERPEIDFCFKTYGKQKNQPPDKPSRPSGPTEGEIETPYTYSSSATDPDGDQLYYLFDWGDGNDSGWRGPYNQGNQVTASYQWNAEGTYKIKVKAKDTNDAESDWSDPLPVSMPKTYENPLWTLIEKLFDWLEQMFGREILTF